MAKETVCFSHSSVSTHYYIQYQKMSYFTIVILRSLCLSIYSAFTTLLHSLFLSNTQKKNGDCKWGKRLPMQLEAGGRKEWWEGSEEKQPRKLFSQELFLILESLSDSKEKPVKMSLKANFTLLRSLMNFIEVRFGLLNTDSRNDGAHILFVIIRLSSLEHKL